MPSFPAALLLGQHQGPSHKPPLPPLIVGHARWSQREGSSRCCLSLVTFRSTRLESLYHYKIFNPPGRSPKIGRWGLHLVRERRHWASLHTCTRFLDFPYSSPFFCDSPLGQGLGIPIALLPTETNSMRKMEPSLNMASQSVSFGDSTLRLLDAVGSVSP